MAAVWQRRIHWGARTHEEQGHFTEFIIYVVSILLGSALWWVNLDGKILSSVMTLVSCWSFDLSQLNLVTRASFPLTSGRKRELWEHPFWNNIGNNRILHIPFHCAVRSLHLHLVSMAHAWNGWSQSSGFPTAGQGERSSGNEIIHKHNIACFFYYTVKNLSFSKLQN